MEKFSYLGNADVTAIDSLYQSYKENPENVDESWKKFFQGFEFAQANYEDTGDVPANYLKELKVKELIDGYRSRGHLFTKTNPVRTRRPYLDTISLSYFGLSEADLNEKFQAGKELGLGEATLKEIVDFLDQTYCHSIGVEYVFNRKPSRTNWLIEQVEKNRNTPQFSKEVKVQILKKLSEAVEFEAFIHKKFVGQKRFSLEGGEAIIPAIDAAIESGADSGVEEVVVGMAHRGRLNVLTNVFGKPAHQIFSEFQGKEFDINDPAFEGDVKYHLGYSGEVVTNKGNKVHMTLAPNPSHLEAVGPVVEGIARAKLDRFLQDENKMLPIIIHGDAAVAGQGVVYEVVQMAELAGYKTGGTIHLVINNQIGFTTNYQDGRSSTYCTAVGQITLSPVFHVNGDDPEALVHVMKMAIDYRQKYNRDVFIDVLCYRKYGHNEGDEPKFTQPLLYKTIAKHKNPKQIYAEKLMAEGIVNPEEVKAFDKELGEHLQKELDLAQGMDKAVVRNMLKYTWKDFRKSKPGEMTETFNTAVDKDTFLKLANNFTSLPEDKKFFRKINKLFGDRQKMIETDKLDWAMGELSAYATLLNEGFPVRISGQDVERGTFSHRHAVVLEEETATKYYPLRHVSDDQADFTIYNSLLSEYGVLGFEYGYAMASPNGLTIWEAQFGDFANGAQIIFDQFISAAEDKWNMMNGIVILLPHGYEGQGAEHSSARLERWLQMCADDNMQVMNITSPANYFHALRRQLKREFRKSMIVMTPKSLLRHPQCVSSIEEFTNGSFQMAIDDKAANAKKTKRVVLVSGKLYYELLAYKTEHKIEDVALVRVEQLYPFPTEEVNSIVDKYGDAEVVWAQEEPENMGAFTYLLRTYRRDLKVISRMASGAPASGSSAVSNMRQERIIKEVFDLKK